MLLQSKDDAARTQRTRKMLTVLWVGGMQLRVFILLASSRTKAGSTTAVQTVEREDSVVGL